MKSVDIHEARTHLSRLVERVEAGEEIIITKAGRPSARLVPMECARKPLKVGGLKARGPLPEDFDTMFEDDIAALFAAGATASAGTQAQVSRFLVDARRASYPGTNECVEAPRYFFRSSNTSCSARDASIARGNPAGTVSMYTISFSSSGFTPAFSA
jgi:prevent-host-death family protein